MPLPFENCRNIDFVLVFDTLATAREFSGGNECHGYRSNIFVKIAQILGKQKFKSFENY
jgi:hypothetical protein